MEFIAIRENQAREETVMNHGQGWKVAQHPGQNWNPESHV
jgi:hypothetical protein